MSVVCFGSGETTGCRPSTIPTQWQICPAKAVELPAHITQYFSIVTWVLFVLSVARPLDAGHLLPQHPCGRHRGADGQHCGQTWRIQSLVRCQQRRTKVCACYWFYGLFCVLKWSCILAYSYMLFVYTSSILNLSCWHQYLKATTTLEVLKYIIESFFIHSTGSGGWGHKVVPLSVCSLTP